MKRNRNLLRAIGCAAVVCFVMGGVVSAARQEELAQSVLRLHIVANSDSKTDQEVKLRVRDALLEKYADAFSTVGDSRVGEGYMKGKLGEIEALANRVLAESGGGEAARASITEAYFPTREYDGFTLPPGRYRALRIEIGRAEGQNWWCVLFPPLCMSAAEADGQPGLTAGEIATITTDAEVIRLKFLSVELYCKALEMFEN